MSATPPGTQQRPSQPQWEVLHDACRTSLEGVSVDGRTTRARKGRPLMAEPREYAVQHPPCQHFERPHQAHRWLQEPLEGLKRERQCERADEQQRAPGADDSCRLGVHEESGHLQERREGHLD
eukprot:CAMPEP_0183349118 /NCGR_PEP_ID=MMETSP0164_2-20130417/13407_1 /TAXON_ID=221442 /ORGANISM="Coccolithus pelagicus ssp braarudi, Strain PLY182g" /LENGTH=122 /DNA_ID=CAMNT_0025520797 /DNA_START=264 /DNA_END=629 /DNA_ORIENTATION=-